MILKQWSGCHFVMDDSVREDTGSAVLKDTLNYHGSNKLEMSYLHKSHLQGNSG